MCLEKTDERRPVWGCFRQEGGRAVFRADGVLRQHAVRDAGGGRQAAVPV